MDTARFKVLTRGTTVTYKGEPHRVIEKLDATLCIYPVHGWNTGAIVRSKYLVQVPYDAVEVVV